MWNFIKKYWNVWVTPIISFLIGWLLDFSKSSMDTFTSFVSMSLLIFSVLTVLKINADEKRIEKIFIEKVGTSQKQLKVAEQCINPLKQGSEIASMLIEAKNVINNERKKNKMLNWIKKNRGAIVATLGVISTFIFQICGVFGNVAVVSFRGVEIDLLATAGYAVSFIVAVLTYGFSGALKQQVTDNAVGELKKHSKETAQKVAALKNSIATYESVLKQTEESLIGITVLKDAGLTYDTNEYIKLQKQKEQITLVIEKLQEQLQEAQKI